jgi:hypothetical protein
MLFSYHLRCCGDSIVSQVDARRPRRELQLPDGSRLSRVLMKDPARPPHAECFRITSSDGTSRLPHAFEAAGLRPSTGIPTPSTTGKSHLLEALGHAAIGHGCHVQWFSLETLGALINRHRVDDSTNRAIRKIMRADLICIDDIGLLPVTTETAEALYRVVDAAYETRSIALSSNLHPAGFDELMPKTIANAAVDRLLHHAHVVITTGDSIRLTQATRSKGLMPLTN